MGFLPGVVAQKKTRTGNLTSLFFVPVCNSQILVFPDTTWTQVKGFSPFRLCSSFLQRKCRKLCAWQMSGSCSGIFRTRCRRWPEEQLWDDLPVGSAQWAGRGTPQFRKSMWGPACTAATDMREGRKVKLFAMNFCKHIRELCRHPICIVWHIISAGSEDKTFLHCLQLCTHVETRHLHQQKGLLDTRRKISGSGLLRHILNYFCDFPEKGFGRYDLLSPILPYSYTKDSPYMFIKPGFCSLWAALPKNRVRAVEL